MSRAITSSPFYLALLADIADTEWQITESEFLESMRHAGAPLAKQKPEVSEDRHEPD